MSKNFDRRLNDLERGSPSAQQYEIEQMHQLERMTDAQPAHDTAVFVDILKRLAPDDPECAAWLAAYECGQ